MTMTDPIADMLTRLRNANMAMHEDVRMPSSRLKEALAALLYQEGYISGYAVSDEPGRPHQTLTIRLKYSPERLRTITGLRRVSKPGLRGLQQGRPGARGCSAVSAWPCCRPARDS